MMRIMTAIAIVTVAAGTFAAEQEEADLPRNPFWPFGYEGTRHPITVEPRVRPKPKVRPTPKPKPKPAAIKTPPPVTARQREAADQAAKRKSEEAARAAEDKLWETARKALKFGPVSHFSSSNGSGGAVVINNRVYGPGDLVSRNVGDLRFTWTVETISADGKLKLKRVAHRPIRKNEKK